MAKKRPKARPPPESTLPTDRCPNCEGPLKVLSDQPEALCPACGIYVEVLRPIASAEPTVESGPDAVRRRRDLAKFYLTYEDLEDELTEVETEVQEEIEAPAPTEAPPAAAADAKAPKGVPEPVPEEERHEAPRPVEAPPPTETGQPAPVEPTPTPPTPESVPAPEDTVPPAPPEPSEVPEPTEPPEVIVEPEPSPVEADAGAVVEDSGSGAATELIVEEPPYDGSYPEEPAPERWVQEAVQPAVAATAEEAAVPAAPKPRRADRLIFYVGATIVVFGGTGLMLGSILHDMFRVPFMGQAYEAFGPLNTMAAFLGAIFLASGLGAMAFGARRGSRRKERAAGG
ncbi:MAG: hypothetical protein ACT4OI_10050 [Methanobacteriota archaeon]